MLLREYLALHRLSASSFAASLGISQAAVSRYCKGRVPAVPVLRAIIRATKGAVTANDFFNAGTTEIVSHPETAPQTFTPAFRPASYQTGMAAGPGDPQVVAPNTTARPTFFR